jgi:hypothetical protein
MQMVFAVGDTPVSAISYSKRAVVIVDPISTGANLAVAFAAAGITIIKVDSRVFPEHLICALLKDMK